MGPSRRVFCSIKYQVMLQLKLTDHRKQYLFDFLDTGNEPCIIRSGNQYFRIRRSANEIRTCIEKLQHRE